ncbi:uncharacterized protein LOC135485089 isoform X1 [Lineus longissimus]|uniref:uncharacterized protein LOC135485089 isoform X1 n=1 Tax=Lineus longissimus TaxID=88925 RepID=UPI00315D0A74
MPSNFPKQIKTAAAEVFREHVPWTCRLSDVTENESSTIITVTYEGLAAGTLTNEDVVLESIKEDLRLTLPTNALSPAENILCPTVGVNSDCHPATTVHIDAFLYDEDAIDNLCDEGKISRNFCKRCGSHETAPLTFISHSMSSTQLKYIFRYAIPDLSGKTVVDVGSRLGCVLYAAYGYSSAAKVIGIEMNSHFCGIQQTVVAKYGMQDRVMVICADVCTQQDVLAIADVVILHNVFEFFVPLQDQAKIWNFLHRSIRKSGTILVVTPGLEESQQYIEVDFDHRTWVKPVQDEGVIIRANTRLFGSKDSNDSDLGNIHFYQVI